MILLKTQEEIEALAASGAVLGALLRELPTHVAPGVSTGELDAIADAFIRSHEGAVPAFKGLYGFPGSICISVNHEVVHGIPSPKRILQEGDIVSLDAGVRLDGWYTDAAVTVPVGEVAPEVERLLETTREALGRGIAEATAENRLGDIGHAVQSTARQGGFQVVRDLVGHGIGRSPHEDPQVPNYGQPGRGLRLQVGMVLAVEPMLNEGGAEVRTLADRWTVVTADRRRSAHFEHTIAITADGPQVLTA